MKITLAPMASIAVGRPPHAMLSLTCGCGTPFQTWPARKASGWPKRHKLAHAFLWEYSYKRLKLAPISAPTWRRSHLHAAGADPGDDQRQAARLDLRRRGQAAAALGSIGLGSIAALYYHPSTSCHIR